MKKAYLHLIKYALAEGKYIAVHDGEEVFKASNKYKEIKDNIEAVEMAEIVIYDAPIKIEGKDKLQIKRIGWALIICPGPGMVDNEESVADYSVCPFLDEWNKQWYIDEPRA